LPEPRKLRVNKMFRAEEFLKKPEWRTIYQSMPTLRNFFSSDPNAHGFNSLLTSITSYLNNMVDHVENDDPFVWYNLGFNSELIYALGDACPIPVELLGVMHSLIGDHSVALDFIDHAQACGVPGDCCSADKLASGAMHRGVYPDPACTVGINTPCDAQVMNSQVIAELGKAPFFAVDVPYYQDDDTIKHVAKQLWELIPFLEENTKRKMDYDRLREVCDLSNQMTEAIWEWLEWRKHTPLAQSSKLVAFTLILQIMFTGSQEGVNIAKGLLREARERVERGEMFFEERVRAVWYQDPVWTDLQIYDWFERDLGLTVPVDIFGYYANEGLIDLKTPETMMYGLARKLVSCHPMARQFRGNIDVYIRDFMNMIEGWNADCCIFAGHIACKHAWGGIGLFKEALKKADIPLLIFEFDMFDPRVTSYDDVFFEVDRFVNEIVYPKKLRG